MEEEKPVEEEEERVEKKLALFCGSGEGREKFCLRWYEVRHFVFSSSLSLADVPFDTARFSHPRTRLLSLTSFRRHRRHRRWSQPRMDEYQSRTASRSRRKRS